MPRLGSFYDRNDLGGGNKRAGRQRAARAFQTSRAGARRSRAGPFAKQDTRLRSDL
jgi:hypothetical protein